MPNTEPRGQLVSIVERLKEDRQKHLDAVAEINAAFEEHGISDEQPLRRRRRKSGRPSGVGKKKGKKRATKRARKGTRKKASKKVIKKKGKRREIKKATSKKAGRKKFKVTGEQSVIDFLNQKGSATTAEINANWKRQQRGGIVGNILTKFVKIGTLRREQVEGERGSRYRVA